MIGYAHNDWLEIAVNHGFLGILCFIFYWGMFAKTAWGGGIMTTESLVIQLVFLDFLLRTIFSMSYRDMQVDTQLILGFCIAKEIRNEQVVHCN
jgi:ABC-type iron transport system FetAB permease component